MFGRDKTRNAVSPEKNPPLEWDIKTGRNIKWKARLGSYNFGSPVVASGLVWIGTNNESPRDTNHTALAGVLICFRETDGEFLYQYLAPARLGPTYNQAHTGVSCSPLIEGDRLWFVNTRAEVVCLDVGPLQRGEGKPTELWKLDMMDELGVFPRQAVMGGGGICSIAASYRDLIYVITGNGTDREGSNVPSPSAPALLCLDKNTGKVVWEDNSSGAKILFGEWGSPLVIEIGGRAQVVAPQGDGWLRSFDALTGELIWKFDINRKDGKWLMTRGFFSTPPVLYRDRVYIALGNYLEFGELPGRLVCLDPTKKGDISLELDDGPGKGKPNPNAGAVWHFDKIHRMMSTVAIHDGLVIAPDHAGFVHCLDADTGRTNWKHDMRAHVISSPLIADGKVYVGDEDGKYSVLALSKAKQLLAESMFDGWITSAPIFANGVLYAAGGDTLYAIEEKSGSWPQWRGTDRSNRSSETGLLKSWPTNGPPLLWNATGLGTGIASVSVASGRVHTLGYRGSNEFVFALDAKTGDNRWTARVGPAVNENALMRWMTQRTPTLDGDRLYTMTASGTLLCLRASTGEQIWQKSYPIDFSSKGRVWGFSDYPLVDDEKLICSPVGSDTTVIALDKGTGATIWSTLVPGGDSAGYAATVVSEAGGIRQYVVFLSKSLVGIAAQDGRVLWRYERPATRTASSYTPIVSGDFVFSANGYGGGMSLLKLVREGNGIVAQERYHQAFNFNPFQDSTALEGGHVYSIQGTDVPVCIEMMTGKLAWDSIVQAGRGRAALTFADGHLFVRRSTGTMTLAEATPRAYLETGSFLIPDREEASGVTAPVVAGGRLYLRDNGRLLCYDVSADALTKPRSQPKTTVVSLTTARTRAEDDTGTARPRTGKDRAPDAIYVPTPDDIVEKMLELAQVKKTDAVYDLGSGDGRIVIAAAKKFGCQAVGYEIDAKLVAASRDTVQKTGLQQLVRIEHEDIFTVELGGADVIALYLPPPLLQRLLPQFKKLKPGARIVSHQFEIPDLKPAKTLTVQSKEDGEQHKLYLWTAPLEP